MSLVGMEVASRRAAVDHLSQLRMRDAAAGAHVVDFAAADQMFSADRVLFFMKDEEIVEEDRLRVVYANGWLQWWTGPRDEAPPDALQHWPRDALLFESMTRIKKSTTAPWLHYCAIRDLSLAPLLDHRRVCILKSVAWQPRIMGGKLPDAYISRYEAVIDFSRDTLIGKILRGLTTDYPLLVTPHFATVLDAFAGPALDGSGAVLEDEPPRLYAVTERATKLLLDHIADMASDTDASKLQHLVYMIWAVLFSLDAAHFCYGFMHKDLHAGNVMIRPVTGTPYENKTWAYRHRDAPDQLVLVRPDQHRNMMVELIDFGRSTIRPLARRYAARTEAEYARAHRADVAHFLLNLHAVSLMIKPRDKQLLDVNLIREGVPREWRNAPFLVQNLAVMALVPGQPLPDDTLLVAFMPDQAQPPPSLPMPAGRRPASPTASESPPKRVRTERCVVCGCGPPRFLSLGPTQAEYCSRVCVAVHQGHLRVHRPP